MKVLGIVAEYNPFHYGHMYHLDKSKEITGCKYSVAVMSGSFVQRGEPSLVDKWTKAKMAIENGVDLVIELPTIYSIQSAELFALGSIKLLESLNIIDYISFGSEIGDITPLNMLAQLYIDEPDEYKYSLKEGLNNGLSFPVARHKATVKYFKSIGTHGYDFGKILSSPNNILAIEYLKFLYKFNSEIIPITINRIGAGYKEKQLSNKIASATSIRKAIFDKNINMVETYLPPKSFNYIKEYKTLNKLDNYSQILVYLLRTIDSDKLLQYMDVEIGLDNRLIRYGLKYNSITNIINKTITKRYTKTRIQRILIQLLLQLDKKSFIRLNNSHPNYIRVLGMNNNGMYLLKQINEKSQIPIINKFANHHQFKDSYLNEMISYDKVATDLYYLGLDSNEVNAGNKDFTTSPYINKHI